ADPVCHCRADDRAAIRFAAGMFGSLRLAPDTALAEGLGISRETVRRSRQRLLEGGAEALQTHKPGRKALFKLTELVQLLAQQCLDQGWSVTRTAAEVGLTEGALCYHLRQGRLQQPATARRRHPASPATGPTPAPDAGPLGVVVAEDDDAVRRLTRVDHGFGRDHLTRQLGGRHRVLGRLGGGLQMCDAAGAFRHGDRQGRGRTRQVRFPAI
ncbi:MAG: helix-turn-helix domain-containing protein, partial [Armatimonadetes bacterium]|nr:helix-turn-helix domain-containing protein [Armatimonadota bacterium]